MSAMLRRSLSGRTGAAVAVVLRAGSEPALLFIRRPRRDGDRWSGDLAFPGGLSKDGEDAVRTARREAREELGLELGDPVGRLGDRVTAHPRGLRPMRVRPVVFVARDAPSLAPDPREVAEAFWVPLARLARLPIVWSARRVRGVPVIVPALDLDGRALWGLTLAMVRELRREICTPAVRARIMRP